MPLPADKSVDQILSEMSSEHLDRAEQRARQGIALIEASQAIEQAEYPYESGDGHPNLEMAPSKEYRGWQESEDFRMLALYRIGLRDVLAEKERRRTAFGYS